MNYYTKYLKNISKGLDLTEFTVGNVPVMADDFFTEITALAKKVRNTNGRMFFIGNGASASFSNHMTLDWTKNGKIPSFSLSDSSMLTALANDFDYATAMREFIKLYEISQKDLVITTSSSGNSENIVNVLRYCNKMNINTLAFSGLKENNASTELGHYSLFVPLKTYGMVECIHQVFHHLWLDRYMGIEEWNKRQEQNMNNENFRL